VAKVEPKVEPAAAKSVPSKTSFDTATVSAVLGQNRPPVDKCLADGKKSNPNMKGSLQIHLAVDATGKVKQVQVSSTLGSPLVSACVVRSANTWKFPARENGQIAMVSYPFTVK